MGGHAAATTTALPAAPLCAARGGDAVRCARRILMWEVGEWVGGEGGRRGSVLGIIFMCVVCFACCGCGSAAVPIRSPPDDASWVVGMATAPRQPVATTPS